MGRRKKEGAGKIKNIIFLFAAAMLIICVIGNTATVKSFGAQKRTVKVGFFPMDGYNEKGKDGKHSGMDVEYLENLCDYVNWEIEYVDCESWDDALQMLLDKKIDLVGSAQYSSERAKKYEYANLASGYTFGAIAVEGSSMLAYEDFDAMSDITYGIVGTYVRKEEFYEYLAAHGIHKPKVTEYENAAALQEAVISGEVDAMAHSLMEVRDGQRVIGRFAPMPIYYISWQGNDDVMRELNQGISDIKMNRPGLENELMVKYYDSRLDQTVLLTNEEKAYLTEKKELTVGYLDGYYPFSYENDGEYEGLAKRSLEEMSVSTGVAFRYVKMDDMKQAEQCLRDGSIDILSYCGETPQSAKKAGLALTKSYAQAPHVLIMKKKRLADGIQSLAVVQSGEQEHHLEDFVDEDARIFTYDTQADCLEAVDSGEADAAVCDGYLSEYLLGSEFRFDSMEIRGVLSDTHIIYMAVLNDEDSPLLSILNKELIEISDKTVSDYMLQDNFYSRMSLENFVRDNSIVIILIICAIAAFVIFSLYQRLRDSRHIEKLMYHDSEFKIWNLNYLKYRASLKLAERKRERYAVVYTNIRQFRNYNSLYGWHAGQKLLQVIIDVIAGELDSERELYARSYGDRFILFVRYEDLDDLEERLMKLENKISERIYFEVQIHMTLMMGVRCLSDSETNLEYAIPDSIQAMDSLKEDTNNIQIYDEGLHNRLKEIHNREKMLDTVSIEECFIVWYQAKVDIRDGRIVGAEALVRFKDPADNGAIKAPGYFVPYYEQTGRVMELDFFVMEAVCKMLKRRLEEGKEVVPVSCNFSRTHFVKEGFPKRFQEILDKYEMPKELIEVEVTETVIVEEFQRQKIKENMDALYKNGVRLSIDDFGSGYSSLGVFEQIPASVIKLDRSFLLNNEDYAKQVRIMKNIVRLARDLEAQIVCEGVETKRDVELMMEIEAYIAQGYRYCRPIPEEAFEGMLDKKWVEVDGENLV